MKSYLHIFFGVIILVLLMGLGYWLFNKPVRTVNNVGKILSLDKKPTVITKDKSGQSHSSKEIIYVSNKTLERVLRKEIDSLTRQNNIQARQIAGFITVKGEATHVFKPNVKLIEDSLRRVIGAEIDYTSKFFDIKGSTIDNKFTTKFRDSMTLFFRKEPKGFFGLQEKVIADAFSYNKEMTYIGIRSFMVPEVKNNKSVIGLGITTGYGIQLGKNNNISHGLQVTAGLQFRF